MLWILMFVLSVLCLLKVLRTERNHKIEWILVYQLQRSMLEGKQSPALFIPITTPTTGTHCCSGGYKLFPPNNGSHWCSETISIPIKLPSKPRRTIYL